MQMLDKIKLFRDIMEYYQYSIKYENDKIEIDNGEEKMEFTSIEEGLKEFLETMKDTNKSIFQSGDTEMYNTWTKEELTLIEELNEKESSKLYTVQLSAEVNEPIESIDVGNTITFNINDGVRKYKAPILEAIPQNTNIIDIVCLVDEKHFNDFQEDDYTINWCDYDLEECLINGIDFKGEYFCG